MQEKPRAARSNVCNYNEQLLHIPRNLHCPVIPEAMERLNCYHDSASEYGTVLEIWPGAGTGSRNLYLHPPRFPLQKTMMEILAVSIHLTEYAAKNSLQYT